MTFFLQIISLSSLFCFSFAQEVQQNGTACPELPVDCYGDCCDGAASVYLTDPTTGDMRCPGWTDYTTGCQTGGDYCLSPTFNNTAYAKSLGAAEVCSQWCHSQCDYNTSLSCWYTHYDGCGSSYCYYVGSNPYDNAAGRCPVTCPAMCSKFDISCHQGYDANGCSLGDYCIPAAANSYWLEEGTECPNFCYTPCDWTSGEVYCRIQSANGCYMGNTCEVPDADGKACAASGAAMRMDLNPEDELMLSGSPQNIADFYNKLTNMA